MQYLRSVYPPTNAQIQLIRKSLKTFYILSAARCHPQALSSTKEYELGRWKLRTEICRRFLRLKCKLYLIMCIFYGYADCTNMDSMNNIKNDKLLESS